MPDTTDEHLAELEALANAVTPGPLDHDKAFADRVIALVRDDIVKAYDDGFKACANASDDELRKAIVRLESMYQAERAKVAKLREALRVARVYMGDWQCNCDRKHCDICRVTAALAETEGSE